MRRKNSFISSEIFDAMDQRDNKFFSPLGFADCLIKVNDAEGDKSGMKGFVVTSASFPNCADA